MIPHGRHGVGSKQRGRDTEQDGEVPGLPLAGISLDGPVPEGQREREQQERSQLQGEHGRPEEQEEAGGEDPDHQRASRKVIRAVFGEGHFEARDEFLSDGAPVQLVEWVDEQVDWINQHQVQETAGNEQQQESAERHCLTGSQDRFGTGGIIRMV